jgi:hypothetical protein
MCLIQPQAKTVTGDGYRDGVAERRDLFNFYLFTWNTAHFHEFKKKVIVFEGYDLYSSSLLYFRQSFHHIFIGQQM